MKPNKQWINDWHIGNSPSREKTVSRELLDFFTKFWDEVGLKNKSKTTRNRYSNALHALGGYLLEKAVSEEEDKTTLEWIAEYAGPDEGPLIFQDHEGWQEEVDLVCRQSTVLLAYVFSQKSSVLSCK